MRGLFENGVAGIRGGVALRLLTAASFAVFALLWAAVPASAAPAWLAPANLSEAGKDAEVPQVAVDPQGDAVAVWQRYDGTDWRIQASSREAGGVWSAPVDLSTPGREASGPQIALDARGDAVAVWEEEIGGKWIVQTASSSAGGPWSAPVSLSATGQDGYGPQVAFDPQGDAVAVWEEEVGADTIVQTARSSALGAWSAPVDLSALGLQTREPQIALDAEGGAVAVWDRYDGTDWIVQTASSSAAGPWSTPVDLSAPGQNAYADRVAVDPQGDAVVVWERYDGSDEIIQASSRQAGGAWSAPVDLSVPGQNAYYPHVALDAQGEAVVGWERYDGTDWIAQVASGSVGGAWSVPVNLSVPGQSADTVGVALDARGDAIAIWQGSNGSNEIIQASSRRAGGAWSAPVDLSAPGQNAGIPEVALDAEGDAFAVWQRYDGSAEIVQAAGYDAAGPQLRGLSAPASGVVGQPLSFSVSPLDVFSALGATNWSFGDGATAVGTAATHVYATPGTYTVTVTSADALGNPSTATRTLTITPPPAPPVSKALAKAAARAQVKNGKALLKLTCPASGPCEGRVVLTTKVKATKGHSAKKKARAKSVQIGAASFHLAARGHATVAVKLDAKGLAALKAAGKRGLKASLGGTGVKPGPVVLKATPAAHRAHKHR